MFKPCFTCVCAKDFSFRSRPSHLRLSEKFILSLINVTPELCLGHLYILVVFMSKDLQWSPGNVFSSVLTFSCFNSSPPCLYALFMYLKELEVLEMLKNKNCFKKSVDFEENVLFCLFFCFALFLPAWMLNPGEIISLHLLLFAWMLFCACV